MEFKLDLQPDESKQFKFGYILYVDQELAESWGFPEPPVCQHCSATLHFPSYFCEESKKLFCRECAYGEKVICFYEKVVNGHHHYRIIGIRRLKNDG